MVTSRARGRGARRLVAPTTALAFAVHALAGCLFVTDFSGLDDGVRADAGEGGAEAAAGDANSADGRAPFTCDGALMCDPFDTGDLVPPWSKAYESAGSTTRVEADARALSSPNVLLTSVAVDATPGHYAYVARDLTLPGSTAGSPSAIASAKLSFSVFVDRAGTAGRACIAGFVFAEGTGDPHTVRVLVGGAGAGGLVEENARGSFRTFDLSAAPAFGRWSRMSLAIAPGGRIVVELEDKLVLDTAAAPSWPSTSVVRFVLGINFVDKSARDDFAFRFDDVRFDGI